MSVINRKVGPWARPFLGALPFVLLAGVYAIGSAMRLADNPADKLLPSLPDMAQTFWRMASEPDKRSGDLLLWSDTWQSLARLGGGILIAALISVCLGVAIGFLPRARATLAPFVAAISLIPPITILPILFIVFGLGETSKVALIVIGTAPVMTRTLAQAVMDIPREQIVKAETLGASALQMIARVVLPQIWPRLDHRHPPWPGAGVDLSHLGGSHRLHRWPRLPHLPRPPLSRDGCDPALRRVDHAHRLCPRPHPPIRLAAALPLGASRGGKPVSFVEVADLSVSYDRTPIIERINLAVEEGSLTTIVGASGCGKSTFLRLLLSQERPTRGRITFAGAPLPPDPTPDRGIVFQRYSVFPHLTVTENLILPLELERARLFGRLYGGRRKALRDEVAAMLERIGLTHAQDRYPVQLSGGMQQRLAIAQALLKKPRMLLLDEPFGALDPGIRKDMHELLLGLWAETHMTIFMVTHDLAEAFKLGTRLIVFDKLRHDPHDPSAYGATITYDLPLKRPAAPREPPADVVAAVDTAIALEKPERGEEP